eukprot:GGOE01036737.1.p1 GENE.GGOE01036737.1~~GGOE01036737.1.p1  ORF type:complete len:286 (+),score=77.10 GGOE01036737.1:68-925(+)
MDALAVEHCRQAVAGLPCAKRHKALIGRHLLAVGFGLRIACWLDFCVLPLDAVERLLRELYVFLPFRALRAVLIGAVEAPLVLHLDHLSVREQQGDLLDDVQLINVRADLPQPRPTSAPERLKCRRVLRRFLDALRHTAKPPSAGAGEPLPILRLDDSHAVHSSLIHGWLLGYPFVYVSVPHSPKSPFANCLSYVDLLAFQVCLLPSETRTDAPMEPFELLTFTIPCCALASLESAEDVQAAENVQHRLVQDFRCRLGGCPEAAHMVWFGVDVRLEGKRPAQVFL